MDLGNVNKNQTLFFSSFLLVSIFIVASCSIFYELLISTVTTYLLGSSVLHFSLTIGFFMSFMGLGAYLSRYVKEDLLFHFIKIEIGLGLAGGVSCFLLHCFFAFTESFYLLTFLLIATIGVLVGLELPILTRIIKSFHNLREALAKVLAFDYLGALIASVLFPLVLLPFLGTMNTAFLIGLINLSVALASIILFRKHLKKTRFLVFFSLFSIFFLLTGLFFTSQVNRFFEKNLYQDEIIFTQQSPYQKIVLTRWKDDVRLYLNNHLQFSSKDEYRYHEALTLVPQVFNPYIHKVLILGGGDGLAVRELLKTPSIDSIHIVDLDHKVTELCKNHILIKKLNSNALSNPKVTIINTDAFKYIENSSEFYDLIIADLPDPSEPALGKLYTIEFFSLVKKRLSENGIFLTQATSPYFAKKAFWCIDKTLKALFSATLPYHVYVPSFGEWGFIMATHSPTIEKRFKRLPPAEIEHYFSKIDAQFIKPDLFPTFFIFSVDMIADSSDILHNNLDQLKLVEYYANSWKDWNP